jgi:hypothetical protein
MHSWPLHDAVVTDMNAWRFLLLARTASAVERELGKAQVATLRGPRILRLIVPLVAVHPQSMSTIPVAALSN